MGGTFETMSEVDFRLSGIEQYLWERAGYFVRRGCLADGKETVSAEDLNRLAAELIGPEVQERTDTDILCSPDWQRDLWAETNGFADDHSSLARLEQALTICWSRAKDIVLRIAPGSQSRPITKETIESEAVNVRLEAGDILVMNGNLLRRADFEFRSRTWVGKSHPSWIPDTTYS